MNRMRSSKSGRVLRISIRVYMTKGRGLYQQLAWKEEKCQEQNKRGVWVGWSFLIYGGLELQDIVIAPRFLGLIHRQKGGTALLASNGARPYLYFFPRPPVTIEQFEFGEIIFLDSGEGCVSLVEIRTLQKRRVHPPRRMSSSEYVLNLSGDAPSYVQTEVLQTSF